HRRARQRVVDGRVHRRLDQDHRPRHRRNLYRPRAGVLRRGAGLATRPAVARRLARPVALLRRDRQAGGRSDAGQDVHQRAAERLTDLGDPLLLAQALIRRASVTPEDDGAQDVLADALAGLGFSLERLRYGATENLFARTGGDGPHFCFAGHTDVVPVGDAGWSSDPFGCEVRGEILYGRGACDMKGAIAAFVAAAARHLAGGKPRGSISLLITGDEEGPALDGTVRVLEWMAAN